MIVGGELCTQCPVEEAPSDVLCGKVINCLYYKEPTSPVPIKIQRVKRELVDAQILDQKGKIKAAKQELKALRATYRKQYLRKWYIDNAERKRTQVREWQQRNPEKVKAYREKISEERRAKKNGLGR